MKLHGIRVLDLTSFLPGPYVTLAMTDHGAEVIKIEIPGEGDPSRVIPPFDDGESVFFRNINRGKKSITLNLKKDEDRAAFLHLVETADVVVESYRPGVVDRLGVGYEQVSARNLRIVYCSISAYGQDGPYTKHAAHDLAVEATSGVLSMNLGSDGRPAIPAVPIADITAGLQGLAAICMALYARERTGRGDYIDISMHETLIGATLNILGKALTERQQPNPFHGRSTGGAAFYQIYDTADGRQIVLGGQERKFILALLGTLNRLDLVSLTDLGPGPHQAPVIAFLKETFGRMTHAQATELLGGLDICWATVNTLVEGLDDPHLAERGFILKDDAGKRHIGPPIRFKNEPAQPNLRAPKLNEHAGLINNIRTGDK